MAFDYPVFLDLRGVPVLVVGGGAVAARKIEGLLEGGAEVTVVAPRLAPAVAALAEAGRLRHVPRGYGADDLVGQRLVLTATDDRVVNTRVAADATQCGLWVNSADDPANCSFALPAVARQAPVVVAVSTGGASPALASHLRDRIADELFDERLTSAARELARQRDEIRAAGGSTESVEWSDRIRRALAGE